MMKMKTVMQLSEWGCIRLREIIIKILRPDGTVERTIHTTAKDLLIEGEDWTEEDVDMALDLLREKIPVAFALENGEIGNYDFEIVDSFVQPEAEKKIVLPEKPGTTELIAILDMSGSMYPLKDDTIGGFNNLIKEQKKDLDPVNVTLVVFNDRYHKILDRMPVEKVKEITDAEYSPSGMTALLDAVGKTLTELKPDDGEKVIVSITTDGMENASREYNYDSIKHLIEDKKKLGWEIMFIGANIDAIGEAAKLGIDASRAVNYLADETGTDTVYKTMSASVRHYKRAGKMDETWADSIRKDYEERKQ